MAVLIAAKGGGPVFGPTGSALEGVKRWLFPPRVTPRQGVKRRLLLPRSRRQGCEAALLPPESHAASHGRRIRWRSGPLGSLTLSRARCSDDPRPERRARGRSREG